MTPRVDHARRRIVLSLAQLGLLAAAAGGVDDRLAGRAEAAAARAELERAGALGERAPRWAEELAAAVARPRARLEAEGRRPDGPAPAHRVWVGDAHAVVGREAAGGARGEIELAVVPRGLAVLALVRALGLRARAVPPGAAARDADAGALGVDVRVAWRFTSSLRDDALTVLDAGDGGGLWLSEPAGEGRVRLAPVAIDAVLERLAALLGAQPASSR